MHVLVVYEAVQVPGGRRKEALTRKGTLKAHRAYGEGTWTVQCFSN